MPNEHFASGLVVEVNGNPLPAEIAVLMVHAYVDDSRVLPDVCVLRFRDPARNVLTRAGLRIGVPLKLRVKTSEDNAPLLLFSGEVTALEVELDSAGSITEVRGYDHAHRLFRGRRVAAYADMAVSDVVTRVAQRAGLRIDRVDHVGSATSGNGSGDRQISQENISDWDFLQRLADSTGAEVSVIDGAFSFRLPQDSTDAPDPNARARQNPLVLEAHQNLVSLRASVSSAEQVKEVEVRGWDYLHKQKVAATAPARTTVAELPEVTPAGLAGLFGDGTFVATDVPYRTQADASTAATALAGQIAGAFAEIEGVAKGNPRLRAGSSVALANVGEPFQGKYTLSTTRHLFSADAGYTTAFTVSGRQERSLYGLAHGGHGGNGGNGRQVAGLVPAVVTDVRDPERMGRVKVQFPWLADGYASGWARTVQVGAGHGRGSLILPEVGDEVLVGFEQGDFGSPYVLGGLYNGQDSPAETDGYDLVDANSGAVNGRQLVSRTGHRLELVDAAGTDRVRVVSSDGKHLLELDKKANKVTVRSEGTLLVEGKQGVTVDAGSGPLELKGQRVQITSRSSASLEGTTVSVNGQGSAEVTASGTLTVRGGLVRIN
ncbi:MAG TPA: VgrG-related protein [Cryptosporangiaceae bacterium]|nr:VgrG-related protein [Cryptosporangiaceae bacterium]